MNFYERKKERTDDYFKNHFKRKHVTCGACNGSGYYDRNGSPLCWLCSGTGKAAGQRMLEKIKWQRYDGYEVSSVGDKRFSALNAKLKDGRTIEEHYQCDIKGYDVGGTKWRLGKGKPPLTKISKELLFAEYMSLWKQWAKLNPLLIKELYGKVVERGCIISDNFATSEINQANALAIILNEMYDE